MRNFYRSEDHFRSERENVRAFLHCDYTIDLHSHDFWELNLVLSGHGHHRIRNREVAVMPGSVFVIPPCVPHGYTDQGGLCVFHLLFRPAFLANPERADGLELLLSIEPFLRQNFHTPLFLQMTPNHLMGMKTELMPLLDGGTLDYNGADAVRDHTAMKALYWMAHLFTVQIEQMKNSASFENESAVIDAIQYIHEHYGERIRIEDLCRVTFLSKSTFLRRFKAVCGCTPIQYLIEYRVNMALDRTRRGQTKTEIAQECGFFDLSHMERSMRVISAKNRR